MSLWQQLMDSLGGQRQARLTLRADRAVVRSLRELAERERRPAGELAAELLAAGLAQRQRAETSLQRWRTLSPREQEVAALVCLNYTNLQIAARLGLSPETVKTHVRNALAKFALRRKAELRQALSAWDFSAWERARGAD
jgi:DNA-binding CsgD family transcriptional regulator